MTEPRYDLDLTQYHWVREYGDITVFGTWFGRERAPALVLVPTNKLGSEYVIPCVVPLAAAWAWDDERGDGAHCARTCVLFAANLGFNPSDHMRLFKIRSIIADNVGELVLIPPKPTEAVVVADAIRTDEYGREHHSEIIENV